MFQLSRLTPRKVLIVVHDLLATAAAIVASFYIRFEEGGLSARLDGLLVVLPGFVVYAGFVYFVFRLYEGKWRFASLPDLFNIFRAVTVLAVSLLVLDYVLVSPALFGTFFFGKITIALYWFLQMFFLGGPRVAYRYFRFARTRQQVKASDAAPILVLGRAADAEVLLRAIESGAVKKIRPVGILSPSPADQGQAIRGTSVLGTFDDLERVIADFEERGTRVTRLLLTSSALVPEVEPEAILMRARRMGLTASRLPSLDEGEAMTGLRLAPVAVEDLLLRPSVKIDYRRLEQVVAGKSVIVTGGGGSIGAEICDRVVTFGAARLLVIENSEPALHAVWKTLATKESDAKIGGRIADVRDRDRMLRLIADFKPDIVFHAAALKHVPLLERDWGEGIKTNVFGSVNVAETRRRRRRRRDGDDLHRQGDRAGLGARRHQALCRNVLPGARCRPCAPHRGQDCRMRLIAVRFGNVLASNGSVVPKFKAQIEAGGPVTVTHPDMVRYFMTIREACDLVVTAASHALGPERPDVSVYVLNMGQPVKIVDLAERMIRLSGLEPGRDIDDRLHRHAARRAAQRDPVRERGADGRDRHRRASWRPVPTSRRSRRCTPGLRPSSRVSSARSARPSTGCSRTRCRISAAPLRRHFQLG